MFFYKNALELLHMLRRCAVAPVAAPPTKQALNCTGLYCTALRCLYERIKKYIF